MRGGIRFVTAYPITLPPNCFEWMAPLTRLGGNAAGRDDELASVNMIIGASYGGRALTDSHRRPGPGADDRGHRLAVAAEVPIVVVDVMRGGLPPASRLRANRATCPSRSTACTATRRAWCWRPTAIADCLAHQQWAVQLAEAPQSPALLLSDQFMGQSRAVIDQPVRAPVPAQRDCGRAPPRATSATDTPSACRRWRFPARHHLHRRRPGAHTRRGIPSSQARDHVCSSTSWLRKLMQHDYGSAWADNAWRTTWHRHLRL